MRTRAEPSDALINFIYAAPPEVIAELEAITKLRIEDAVTDERAHADRLAEALREAKPATRRALIGIIDDALAEHDKRRSEA